LSKGTYYNVIQYSRSAVKAFLKPVLVSKSNIDAAMNKVSSTWREEYSPGEDPIEWLRKWYDWSLDFRNGSTINVTGALQLAYADAMADEDGQYIRQRLHRMSNHNRTEDGQYIAKELETAEAKAFPQIYFLTSRQPEGGADETLNKIDEFDKGRNIPVHSITFSNATADPELKQFGKDLASKTGGFFRSIEQS